MRLIDADALKSWIDCGHLRNPTELCFSELDLVRMLDKRPTIEAEPVRHGKWIVQDETYTRCFCSECKSGNHQGHEKFCPNCGAKMDLEETEDAR